MTFVKDDGTIALLGLGLALRPALGLGLALKLALKQALGLGLKLRLELRLALGLALELGLQLTLLNSAQGFQLTFAQ
eukprot:1149037-Pelagomonas_calceolata.AAC.2